MFACQIQSRLLFIVLIVLGGSLGEPSKVDFNFTTPGNIEVGQNATYQCAVNDTRVTVTWNMNGNVLPPGFIVTGPGTSSSSLTIPGEVQYNNTEVRCLASGFIDGKNYNNSSDSVLRIQGQLSSVANFTCTLLNIGDPLINCQWLPPFSLTLIHGYSINVTSNNSTLLVTNSTVYTNFNYSPQYYDNYTVSVSAYNTLGEGEQSNESVLYIPKENVVLPLNLSYTLKPLYGWNMALMLEDVSRFSPYLVKVCVHLTKKHEVISMLPYCYVINGTYEGSNLIFNLVLPSDVPDVQKEHWQLTVSLEYGLFSVRTEQRHFSTFDVISGDWSLKDGNTVCFTCHYVTGTNSTGCHVAYNDSRGVSGFINIIRKGNDPSSTGCVEGLISGTYSFSYFDQGYYWYTGEPAYLQSGENIIIPLIPSLILSPSPDPSSPSSTLSPSESPSPSVTPTDSDNSGTIILISVVISVIIVIVVGIGVGLFIWCVKKRKKKKRKETQGETQRNTGQTCNNFRNSSLPSSSTDEKSGIGKCAVAVGGNSLKSFKRSVSNNNNSQESSLAENYHESQNASQITVLPSLYQYSL